MQLLTWQCKSQKRIQYFQGFQPKKYKVNCCRFNNSAYPFKNPNGLTNLIQLVAILCIPTLLVYTCGVFSNNINQAWLVYSIPFAILVGFIIITAIGEYNGNPAVNALLGIHQAPNLEDKEVWFG